MSSAFRVEFLNQSPTSFKDIFEKYKISYNLSYITEKDVYDYDLYIEDRKVSVSRLNYLQWLLTVQKTFEFSSDRLQAPDAINAVNYNGNSLRFNTLMFVCFIKMDNRLKFKIIELLLKCGANVNDLCLQNRSALYLFLESLQYNNKDIEAIEAIIKILLNAGTNLAVKNNDGNTAMDMIFSSMQLGSNFNICEFLYQKYPDICKNKYKDNAIIQSLIKCDKLQSELEQVKQDYDKLRESMNVYAPSDFRREYIRNEYYTNAKRFN